ncbi:hypothetical protein [Pseudonocardia nigra]|uniref:hypothetical protein n=1 Tax=Pseudonocardia nigra TaxID=1921578 RepID=UPI001C5D3DC5|nr:hypothetical protein [Pseudonocardia nigra]
MGGSELELGDGEQRAQQSGRQHRIIVAQRVAWAVLALIALAALAGLLGPGPLSTVTHSDPSGLVQFEHERFARYIGDTSLQLQVLPDPEQPDTAQVWISSDYLSAVQVQQVRPQPDTWPGAGDGAVLVFPVSGPDPISVQLQIRPDQIGLLRGAVGTPAREPVEFWQFVYA